MAIITPKQINPAVIEFGQHLQPAVQPVMLPVESAPHSIPLNCYEDVAKHIAKLGGSSIVGWMIVESQNKKKEAVYLEAQHHAVWKSPDGKLHDISKHQLNFKNIVFVPDPSTPYNGQPIRRKRFNVLKQPKVNELFTAFEALDFHQNNSTFMTDRGQQAALNVKRLLNELGL